MTEGVSQLLRPVDQVDHGRPDTYLPQRRELSGDGRVAGVERPDILGLIRGWRS